SGRVRVAGWLGLPALAGRGVRVRGFSPGSGAGCGLFGGRAGGVAWEGGRRAARDAGLSVGWEPVPKPVRWDLTLGSFSAAMSALVRLAAVVPADLGPRAARLLCTRGSRIGGVMAARKPRAKRMSAQAVEDEDYQLRWERVAAVDVAKASGMVCLRLPPAPGKTRRTSRTWQVPATVPDIEALAAELKAAGVQKIAMESTSDYWRVWFAVLEGAGLGPKLVDASQAKNLPGRPKTDRLDAQWLARLAEMGLLRESFVPPPEIRALRAYTRQLVNLTGDRTRYWQRMEKLLEGALCKLSSVASQLAGNRSCLDMITAMIAGERDPHALAAMAQGRMRAKHAALVKAFTGMQFNGEHAFTAQSYLRMIAGLDAEIEALEARIREHLETIPAAWGADADGTTGPGAGLGPDAAVLPAIARLDEIPGVSAQIAAGIIAEIGLDMSVFPTPQALVS